MNHHLNVYLLAMRNAKSYWCYHRATKQVISSYHVRFLESHDGHPLPSPTIHTPNSVSQAEPFTLNDIINQATTTPADLEDDEDSDPKNGTVGEPPDVSVTIPNIDALNIPDIDPINYTGAGAL